MTSKKNGKRNGKKDNIKRGQGPVTYRIRLQVDVTDVRLDAHFGGVVEVPIHEGFGKKWKKKDVIEALGQITRMIETGDYSPIGVPINLDDVAKTADEVRKKKAESKPN